MESCDTGACRTLLSLLTAGRSAQAVNLDTVVERVYHTGRNRWNMRREKTSDPFDFFTSF